MAAIEGPPSYFTLEHVFMVKCDAGHKFWELLSNEMVAVRPRTFCKLDKSSIGPDLSNQPPPRTRPT